MCVFIYSILPSIGTLLKDFFNPEWLNNTFKYFYLINLFFFLLCS